MIASIDQQLAAFGIGAPIRFKLRLTLVKLKLTAPIDGKKIQLKITAMKDDEKKMDVWPSDRITNVRSSNPENDEFAYKIEKHLDFDMSYGVTKVSIKGFHTTKLGRKSLAFFADLSLKKIFETDQVSTSFWLNAILL